jgi:hypothetical protein
MDDILLKEEEKIEIETFLQNYKNGLVKEINLRNWIIEICEIEHDDCDDYEYYNYLLTVYPKLCTKYLYKCLDTIPTIEDIETVIDYAIKEGVYF